MYETYETWCVSAVLEAEQYKLLCASCYLLSPINQSINRTDQSIDSIIVLDWTD